MKNGVFGVKRVIMLKRLKYFLTLFQHYNTIIVLKLELGNKMKMKCKIICGMTAESHEDAINEFLSTDIEKEQVNQHHETEKIMRPPTVCYVVPTGNAIAIIYC